jgi:hypothetical protein
MNLHDREYLLAIADAFDENTDPEDGWDAWAICERVMTILVHAHTFDEHGNRLVP